MKKTIRALAIIILLAICPMQISCDFLGISIDPESTFSAPWQKDLNQKLKETYDCIEKIQYLKSRKDVSRRMIINVSEKFNQNQKRIITRKILRTILANFEAEEIDFKEAMRESGDAIIRININFPDDYQSNLQYDSDKECWTFELFNDKGDHLLCVEKMDFYE